MVTMMRSAVDGMHGAMRGMQVAAHNLSNLATEGFSRQRLAPSAAATVPGVETLARPGPAMLEDLVALRQGELAFAANLAVFRAADRLAGSLLDAVA